MPRIKQYTAEEQDAFSKWRHMQNWQRGELKAIKRRHSKFQRRLAKLEISRQLQEATA